MALCLTSQEVLDQLSSSRQAYGNVISSNSLISNFKNSFGAFPPELEEQINTLREKEKEFCDLLGVDNLEKANEKLTDLRQDIIGLNRLSGSSLNTYFLKPAREALKDYRASGMDIAIYQEEQAKFKERFIAILQYEANKLKNPIKDSANLKKFVFQMLQAGGYGKHQHLSTAGFEKGITEEIVNHLFRDQRKAAERFVQDYMNKHPVKFKKAMKNRKDGQLEESVRQNLVQDLEVSKTENSVVISSTFNDWSSITYHLTGEKAKDLSPDKIKEVKGKLYRLIIDTSGIKDPLFDSVTSSILDKSNVFFGDNVSKDVNGLLGEIAGAYIISKLLGKGQVIWQGGLIGDNSKKPHEDLIIETLEEAGNRIGIQVKNTTKSLSQGKTFDVDFTEKISTSFPEIEEEIGQNNFAQLSAVYGMKSFNVEYHMEGNTAEPGNPRFAGIRAQIEHMAERTTAILSVFAGNLMYMQLQEEIKKLKGPKYLGNTIYLVAGKYFFSAAEQLENIFLQARNFLRSENFEKTTAFQIEGSFKDAGTIIDYINMKADNREQLQKKWGNNGPNLLLKSSYTFTMPF